ncbi:hypothetical protein SKAU_G00186510 [Synaphobranchus kaupii]|uniref:Uncharacterized protein n=1 Tax=Synaphobranchus kaupii TaxID=118154 RepID=A0A9Q1FCQ7_SYNKA|nr:hypothetical protein SKAU_G00186510 [Synaphobranchus kaupii]
MENLSIKERYGNERERVGFRVSFRVRGARVPPLTCPEASARQAKVLSRGYRVSQGDYSGCFARDGSKRNECRTKKTKKRVNPPSARGHARSCLDPPRQERAESSRFDTRAALFSHNGKGDVKSRPLRWGPLSPGPPHFQLGKGEIRGQAYSSPAAGEARVGPEQGIRRAFRKTSKTILMACKITLPAPRMQRKAGTSSPLSSPCPYPGHSEWTWAELRARGHVFTS